MTDNGFRPLVDDSAKAFETNTNTTTGSENHFHRLEFMQETPEQAADFEALETNEAEAAEEAPVESGAEPPLDSALAPEPAAPEETEAASPVSGPPEADPGILEVERQAFEMGFEKGEREGFGKGEERAMEMLVRLENLILGFEGAWRRCCETHEQQLVRLALVVAEKVALAKADGDDELAARSLVEALAALENPGVCTVRVSPTDFQSVERLRGDLFQRVANLQEITILPDSAVEEGEVRIESDNGWLETHARKRLDEVLSRVSEAAGLTDPSAGEVPGAV